MTTASIAPGPDDPAVLLAVAVDLCRQAGREILALGTTAPQTAVTKSSPTDPVTIADQRAEELIVEGLSADRPNDGIMGEEGANRTGTSGYDWHVDPIDGTTNFVYGLPAFSVSVAVAYHDVVVAGAVYNPSTDEMFTATLGGGAFLNESALAVTETDDLALALIATGFSYHAERRASQAATVAQLLGQIRDIRRFGSAALDLCSVAAGRVDAYYEDGLNRWDYAAGLLIAEEAGASSSGLHQTDPGPESLIVATPAIMASLLEVLQLADNSG